MASEHEMADAGTATLGFLDEEIGIDTVRRRLHLDHDLAAATDVGGDPRTAYATAHDIARPHEAA